MRRMVFAWLPVVLCVMAGPVSAATVTVKADKTPLRSAAAATASVVAELKAGTVLDVIEAGRDWYRVRDQATKQEGFLPASAVIAKPASRPPRPPRKPQKGDWTDMGYLFVNGLLEAGGSEFTQSQSWRYFAETATATAAYPSTSAFGFDASGGYRVWRNLAVGAGVTVVSRSTTPAYSGSMPNPLYLNRPNLVSGTFAASNSETAINLQAAWGIPVSPRMLVVLFAGPSIFTVKQTVIAAQGISVSSGYPYDSTAATVSTQEVSKTAFGFGAGADVSYYFSKTVGVGGMIRVARATAEMPVNGQPSVAVAAGGFQLGGGLRIRFAAPKPKGKPNGAKPSK